MFHGAYAYKITEKGQAFKQTLKEKLSSQDQKFSIDQKLINKLSEQSSQFLEMLSTYIFLLESGYQPNEAKGKAVELKPHLGNLIDESIKFYNANFSS